MVQEPVESGTDQHHHIGLSQDKATGRCCRQWMIIRQDTFRHRHRQEWNACLFYELLQLFFRLRISGSLTDDNQRLGRIAQEFQGTLDSGRTRQLYRCRINWSKEGCLRLLYVQGHAEHGCGDIEVHPTRSSRQGSTNGSGHSCRNILRTIDAVSRFHKRFRYIHLVEPFVIALLQVDNVTVTRTTDLYHRKTVDGGFGQGSQAIQKTGSRNGEADTWLLGKIATDSSSMTCRLFMTEPDVSDTGLLGIPCQIGHRNAHHSENGFHTIHLQGIYQEMHTVGEGSVGIICYIVHSHSYYLHTICLSRRALISSAL